MFHTFRVLMCEETLKLSISHSEFFLFCFFRNFMKYENGVDLGMKPAHGLKVPKLNLKEMKKELKQSILGECYEL